MESFEFPESLKPPGKRKTSTLVWNVLTILVLVATLCVVSYFFLIYIDPNSNINPFPPTTLYPSVVPPTFTVTPRFTLVPSWTPTNANPMVASYPQATESPAPTAVPEVSISIKEPTVTQPAGDYAFIARVGSPSAIAWTTFHPDAGCDWSGVAGQATSLNGEAVKGLFVQLGGAQPGVNSEDKVTMTGLNEEYGPGGFEFIIANYLLTVESPLWIQLFDQQMLPLSDRIYFEPYADCEKNLIIIYFDQIH